CRVAGNARLGTDSGQGPLQRVRAQYDAAERKLTLRFPDGNEISEAAAENGEQLVARFHGTPKPARRVPGPWDEALSEVAREPVRLVAPGAQAPAPGRGGGARRRR